MLAVPGTLGAWHLASTRAQCRPLSVRGRPEALAVRLVATPRCRRNREYGRCTRNDTKAVGTNRASMDPLGPFGCCEMARSPSRAHSCREPFLPRHHALQRC